jgi:cobyrinic acid a,c-diamide synthase
MQQDSLEFPRLIISALRGGSGKTILSIGIIAALKAHGKAVSPFKKGPDYIDAGWLALAAGRPCYNLDTFMVSSRRVFASFLSRFSPNSIAIIEGNRGLYDGIDLAGSTSTAELAKLLHTPVILCIDATKTTRTMAAVVSGCKQFDPQVKIKGVILNRVAGARHENILRQSIEAYCDIPVLGAVPKLNKQNFPERHMGLVPTPEHAWARDAIDAIGEVVGRSIDLRALAEIAHGVSPLQPAVESHNSSGHQAAPAAGSVQTRPRIGIIKDAAFQFYYPENVEALVAAGAEVLYFSPLKTNTIPAVDALYIGGGFPETHVEMLAENLKFKMKLKSLADSGLPIYAECGGLMYLGEKLVLQEKSYPMAGVLPIVYGFSKKPQGHGYTIFAVEKENPYFDIGSEYRGHEFHYSKVLEWRGGDEGLVFRMKRGNGIHNERDGACYKNVLATFTHLHALGTPAWADALIRNAAAYRKSRAHAEK